MQITLRNKVSSVLRWFNKKIIRARSQTRKNKDTKDITLNGSELQRLGNIQKAKVDLQNLVHDVVIIGGGPSGLMTAFYCGINGIKPLLLEALDFVGGQPAALYPEKGIFDMPGILEITGGGFARALDQQVTQMEPYIEFNQTVNEIKQEDGIWHIACKSGNVYKTKTIILAIGKGAFSPNKLNVPGEEEFQGKGVYYTVQHIDDFKKKNVLIVGGGDSAMDWVFTLQKVAKSITLIHRRDGFRAHPGAVNKIKAMAEAGKMKMFIPYEIKKIEGDERVEKVTIFNNKTKEEKTLTIDSVIVCAGFKPTQDALKQWGLDLNEKGLVKTSEITKTNLSGVFAIGDITEYPAKRHLLVVELGEAAIAAGAVTTYIYGKEKGGAEWWGGPKKKRD